METASNFDFKKVLSRIVKEIDIIINKAIEPKSKTEKKDNKKNFFVRNQTENLIPISRDTYYNYTAYTNGKREDSPLKSISLATFYEICKTTNVSADYFLGFIQTKRKEQSADMVSREFGLSDKAIERLKMINQKKADDADDVVIHFVNMLLEYDYFWESFEYSFSDYLSVSLKGRESLIDPASLRYGLVQKFEHLIDYIEKECRKEMYKTPKQLFELPDGKVKNKYN